MADANIPFKPKLAIHFDTGLTNVVDLKASANTVTALGTTQKGTGQIFYPTHLIIHMVTASATATIAASGSLGFTTNAELLPITALVGVLLVGNYLIIPIIAVATVVAEATAINFKLTTAITSTGTAKARMMVAGFYAPASG